MHIFLTGDIQVGKSTIIRRWLSSHPGLKPGGFLTVWNGDRWNAGASLHIVPADGSGQACEENCIKRRTPDGMRDYPAVYDRVGTALLNSGCSSELIVMDEVGPGENEAFLFHKAVLNVLDGDVPVLGVVRALPGVLPDAVRAHSRVRVITVTVENRDAVLSDLLKHFPEKQNLPFSTNGAGAGIIR